jgi:hypothetical protein
MQTHLPFKGFFEIVSDFLKLYLIEIMIMMMVRLDTRANIYI